MVLSICGGTSIDIVARSRWSRSRSAKNDSSSPGPVTCRELPRVLDAVRALPLRGFPVGGGHPGPAGEPAPVWFGQLMSLVHVWLRDHERSPPNLCMIPKDLRYKTEQTVDLPEPPGVSA